MDNDEIMPSKSESLIEQQVGDELLVLAASASVAHNLNGEALKVFQACDGETPQSEVAASLGEGGQERLPFILSELAANGLIGKEFTSSLNRRDFLAAAAKVGLITPILAGVGLSTPAAAQSSCSTPPCAALALGGGPSTRGPGGCTACCGPTADTPCQTCPANCSVCACKVLVRCSNDGASPASCAASGPDICQNTSNDFIFTNPVATGGGCVDDMSFAGGIASRPSCAAAKAASTGTLYACCQCP